MQKSLFIALALFILTGCKKENEVLDPSHPIMTYYDLGDYEVSEMVTKNFDIDGDGIKDFGFEALLVGDPVLKRDRKIFYVYSKIHTSLLSDNVDNSPALVKGQTIKPVEPGYSWWPVSAIPLAEMITPQTGPVFWEGNFKDAARKYLPLKVNRNGQDFYGWLELSINQPGQKMILHRTGLSTEAGKAVKAGF